MGRVPDADPGGSEIWLYDLVGGSRTRLTFSRGTTPVWSPDGTRIAFTSRRNGVNLLYQRAADGTGGEIPLFDYDRNAWVNDWSSDGRWVIYSTPSTDKGAGGNGLWAVLMAGGTQPKSVPYLIASPMQQQAQFSPDGRFIAYGSDQSGTWEIYVQPFPNAADGKWMVSSGGGTAGSTAGAASLGASAPAGVSRSTGCSTVAGGAECCRAAVCAFRHIRLAPGGRPRATYPCSDNRDRRGSRSD